MGENRGQTIFLSVIGIATLLVAIIGATFAYFTTQVDSSSVAGGSTSGQTAKISGTTLTFEKNTGQTISYLQYPGGLAVFGTKANFKEDDTSDANTYVATFDLEIDYANPTGTDLHYTLYMVEDAPEDADLDPKCKLKTLVDGTNTYLWFADQNDDGSDKTTECTFGAEALAAFSVDKTVASGTLKKNTPSGKITAATELGAQSGNEIESGDSGETNPLKGRQLDTSSNGVGTKYYYLVIDYPNLESDQATTDATGLEISATLKVDESTVKVDQGTVSARPGAGA